MQNPDLGQKLSQAEYERRIMALHASSPAMPTKSQDRAIRRAELDLLIDYKLGIELSQSRRDALWSEQMRHDRSLPWRLFFGFISNPKNPSVGLAKSQARAYAAVLSLQELSALLDLPAEDVERLLK